MALQPLTIKKFSTNRVTFNLFDFASHLEETGLKEKFTVKDKKHGGSRCTYKVYIDGKRDERRLHGTTTFTSGLELNTGDIAAELAEMAAANPGGALVFEIYEL